jgi:hypothetical protein
MTPLATTEDYAKLIGPVPEGDEPRLETMLDVASSVVAQAAPGLLLWYNPPIDPDTGLPIDPGPVPAPATFVTCQVASGFMDDPTGSSGPVTMERVGLVETQYAAGTTGWDALLPAGWRLLLKPWTAPELASVKLVVPHPAEYFADGWGVDWWASGEFVPPEPSEP